MSIRLVSGLCALGVMLSGCTSWQQPAPEPIARSTSSAPEHSSMTRSRYGNPPTYEVFGVRYNVMDSSVGYKERGIASWYGKKFHGRLTSSRERYDMYRMTAAHKSLPLPTNVKVTNLENGKSVIVRVNDRGPFVKGRIIDLSYVAAEAIDMTQAGTARVEVEALPTSYTGAITTVAAAPSAAGQDQQPTSASAPAEPDLTGPANQQTVGQTMYVQVGAFGEAVNARSLAERLAGVGSVSVTEPGAGEPVLYRVRIGPFTELSEYDRIVAEVKALQIATTQLVVEEDTTAAIKKL